MIDAHLYQLSIERAESEKEIIQAMLSALGKMGFGNEASPRYWDKLRPYLTKRED